MFQLKRSYHTDLAIQYKLGILDNKLAKAIPTSTLHNWKNRDFSLFVGMEHASDFSQNIELIKAFLSKKYLINAAKALYFIYMAHVRILNSVKSRNKIFRQSKEIIISTIDRVKEYIGLKRAVKAFNISFQQYNAWKNSIECKITPASFCRKIYSNQLSNDEIDTIKEYFIKPEFVNWSAISIYYQILREKAAYFGMTTFYKYVNRLSLQRPRLKKKRNGTGIRAIAPKRTLHIDVTIFKPLDYSRVYLYFLVDNFSRFILNWKASLEYSANITFQNISEAYETYELDKLNPYISLICDGGPENKGMVDEFVNRDESNIQKLVAQTDIVFSNSIIEAVNKRMKYDFLFTANLLDIGQTIQYLEYAVKQYNNKPHSALFGLTPYEAFNGAIPDKDMFKPAIKQAAQDRKLINLGQECLNCR